MKDGKPCILVVDDEEPLHFLVQEILDQELVISARTGAEMEKVLASNAVNLVLLDIGLPDADGFELAARLLNRPQDPPFLFLTARDSPDDAARGLSLGALDYVRKPFAEQEFIARVRAALLRSGPALVASAGGNDAAGNPPPPAISADRRREVYDGILGSSPALMGVITLLDRAARQDAVVLLSGESGTGKELLARAYHRATGRGNAPFVPINCSSIPRDLAESLFFGHSRGTFTGAGTDRVGWFEEARGGTLFLDEIGDLPQELQGVLLRVLETRRIRRLGEKGERDIDVRLVAATNRNLEAMAQAGDFRADLFYRLDEIPVVIPPLRERREDIPSLCRAFLAEFQSISLPAHQLQWDPEALYEMVEYPWPGNVRQLRNAVRRLVLLSTGGVIRTPLAVLGLADHREASAEEVTTLHRLEQTAIEDALRRCDGNVPAAARELGMSRATMYRRLKRRTPGSS